MSPSVLGVSVTAFFDEGRGHWRADEGNFRGDVVVSAFTSSSRLPRKVEHALNDSWRETGETVSDEAEMMCLSQ